VLLTEEFNTAKLITLRKFKGRSTNCFAEMSDEILALSVLSRDACSMTSTISDVDPTAKRTFCSAV